jgi:hypothetical protein
MLHGKVQENLVLFNKKVGGARFPLQKLFVVFRYFEVECGSAIQKTDGAGAFREPDGETSGIESDRTEFGLWASGGLSLLDPDLNRLEGLSGPDPGGAAELRGETESFTLFVGFLMEADPIGVGVGPALGADEVKGFGVGNESGQNIGWRGLKWKSDGSSQSHNMTFYNRIEVPLKKMGKVFRKEDAGNSSRPLKTAGFPCQNCR